MGVAGEHPGISRRKAQSVAVFSPGPTDRADQSIRWSRHPPYGRRWLADGRHQADASATATTPAEALSTPTSERFVVTSTEDLGHAQEGPEEIATVPEQAPFEPPSTTDPLRFT